MKTVGPQTVLITGATGGLGKAFAVECARRGWNLFLTDRQTAALENLARRLEVLYNVEVHLFACDLAEHNSRVQLIQKLEASTTKFTMLINVAGIDFEGLFTNQTMKNLLTLLHLDIEAPVELMHKLLKIRKKDATFRIINVSSMAAFNPMPHKAVYAASKRFLLDFSRALSMELRETNASVTVLCPAGMPTNPWCMQAIAAQGWVGQVTTMDVGRVAFTTLESALRGKRVVIPGLINVLINGITTMLPAYIKMRWIHSRWEKVRANRIARGELQTL